MNAAEMKDRIKYILREKKLTQTQFANGLNVSLSLVSLLCSGGTPPSKRTISDICRVYGVNPEWLRDGVGEPFLSASSTEYLADIFANAQISDTPKMQLVKAIVQMPDETIPAVLAFVKGLAKVLPATDE